MTLDDTRSAERRTPAIVEEAGGGGPTGAVVQAATRSVRNAAPNLMDCERCKMRTQPWRTVCCNVTGGTRYLPLHGWFSRWPDVTGPSVRRCRFHVRCVVSSSSTTTAVGRISGRGHSSTCRAAMRRERTAGGISISRRASLIRSRPGHQAATKPDRNRVFDRPTGRQRPAA